MMRILKQKTLTDDNKHQILKLWNDEYPAKLSHKSIIDFENYLNNLSEQRHYLLLNDAAQIEGWAISFLREHEKWFAIIISGELHGKGFGTLLLNKLKEDEPILNGWVIDHELDKKADGSFYKSPLKFYLKNNFQLISETRLEIVQMSAVKILWKKTVE